jgi:hypothetical protein
MQLQALQCCQLAKLLVLAVLKAAMEKDLSER